MAEVFISYARSNEDVARRVANGLKASGYEAWWDDQLPAHRAYTDIIEQRLRGAAAVVVLWSKDAAQSQWVRAEADFARTESKLIQAQLDGTLPPMPFNQIQCADLTSWRGNRKHRGWAKLVDGVSSVVSGAPLPLAEPTPVRDHLRIDRRMALAAVAMALLLLVAAVIFLPRIIGGGDDRPPRVAVLPFKNVGGSDEGLVAGLWEDTRQALSRNPQLIVLGPNTSEEIAEMGSIAARKAADYLVEATVRTATDNVRINTSLVRSKDGVQVWSQTFDRKLDDVFALQSEIAQEIEGRIRGRLARGGGVNARNIATSGAVYLLFSDARAAIRARDGSKIAEAHRQLKQAVRMDPNFAPAWATLAVAERLIHPGISDSQASGNEAEAYARRAITLAPNLASAHAALGLALGSQGPVAEAALRRAIALDPNDVESLNWLASVERRRGRMKETLALYDAAIKIEPLWWPVVINRLDLLLESNQASAVEQELSRLDRAGDDTLATRSRMQVLEWRGDYSEAVRIGLTLYRRSPDAGREMVRDNLAALLLELDYADQAWKFSHAPAGAASVWRNEPSGVDRFEALKVPPKEFWRNYPGAEAMSRTYLEMARGVRLAKWYKDGAGSPEQFLAAVEQPDRLVHLAPLVALGLKQSGDAAEAARLLSAAEKILATTHGIGRRELPLQRARLYAVQGRLPEAAAALRQAVGEGWLPPAPLFKPDLSSDAPLALLKGRPEFQQARTRILAHLARERAELGHLSLSAEGPRS